ncbi:hypothetical protein MTsPCn5_27800 [Croceitalea sp. MTPC5]|uniref:hypothetical protein n=1 Tax=Croceitalea sp. MTPC5 TaxID=3056565 RepID=UPI002B379986|nr:hypothetical protein MTsPCn5_27800 [Croceitalea sp. MTPC5]
MRSFLLFLTFVFFFNITISQTQKSNECKQCNYITDYYPMVYKAQLKYLENDLDSASHYLNVVKKKCGFLNTPDILERVMYAEIQVKKQNYTEAFESLEDILSSGFPFGYLENNEALNELKKDKKWTKLRELSSKVNDEKNDSFNWPLRYEIIAMVKSDQKVRSGTLDYEKMKKIDSSHQRRIKEIFETYGYPNEKLVGFSKTDEKVDITVMLMHCNDLNYFKPKLLDFIKKGECNPYTLASMVDSNNRKDKMFTYGIYRSSDSTEIRDFHNLDTRRKSIGLRSLKNHQKTMSLLMKKYSNN